MAIQHLFSLGYFAITRAIGTYEKRIQLLPFLIILTFFEIAHILIVSYHRLYSSFIISQIFPIDSYKLYLLSQIPKRTFKELVFLDLIEAFSTEPCFRVFIEQSVNYVFSLRTNAIFLIT